MKIGKNFLILFITIGLTSFTLGFGQEETEGPSKRIVKFVDVRNNKTVSGATILSKLKTKKGDIFSQKVVDEDIKRLYLLGYFSDVSVSIEDVQDGVGVIFEVTEKPPLIEVVFI